MRKSNCPLLCALFVSIGVMSQNITLDWYRTEAYQHENSHGKIVPDAGTGDVLSLVHVWVNDSNTVHAHALNRRDAQGQLLHDTIFDNNSYLDYSMKGVFAKNGETYYCLNHIYNELIYTKLDVNGDVVWTQTLPYARFFFCDDWDKEGDNYVIDDSLNNRMLWCFELWSANYTNVAVGILATDNTTGAITILDTINYPGPYAGTASCVEIERDANGHVYLTSTDESGGMLISLLENGQLVNVATIDSAGWTFRDYPQHLEIVGSTMFVTSQVELNGNTRINEFHIYAIDATGHLTLLHDQNFMDTQHHLAGLIKYGNYCYLYTSGYESWEYPLLTPTIWKYDSGGNLVNTFVLSAYTGYCILDLSVTSHALYCSMASSMDIPLVALHPSYGYTLGTYNLQNEFTIVGNDEVVQLEAQDQGAAGDVIYASGGYWQNNMLLYGRLAKYIFLPLENGVTETGDVSLFTLFPNPAGDFVLVNTTGGSNGSVELLDARGRLISTQPVEGQTSIDLRGLSSGLYFIRLCEAELVSTQRFVKE